MASKHRRMIVLRKISQRRPWLNQNCTCPVGFHSFHMNVNKPAKITGGFITEYHRIFAWKCVNPKTGNGSENCLSLQSVFQRLLFYATSWYSYSEARLVNYRVCNLEFSVLKNLKIQALHCC